MNKPDIKPASRANLIEEYYFSRKLKEIAYMRKGGADIINLGIGSPDLPPSPSVIETLCRNAAEPGNHGYQSYTGIPALRKAFSAWYKKWYGVDLNPDDEILPLIGSKEGIMHISMAFLDPGDEVLIPNPGYPTYEAAARLAGGTVKYYDLTEETAWLPDLKKIEASGIGRVKIMWINYPHMPSGAKATRDSIAHIVDFAGKHGILLCHDNPYSFILNDDPVSVFTAEGSREVALELNSLSKSHCMAGWRVGMVGGKAEFISAVMKVKSNMDSGMFQPVQAAAAVALEASDEWYKELNRIYRIRRSTAEEIMRLLGCRFDEDQAGLFLWANIPSSFRDAEELTEHLLKDAHVFITPGSVFGSNGDRYIRISLCATEDRLKEAAVRIDRVLKSLETF